MEGLKLGEKCCPVFGMLTVLIAGTESDLRDLVSRLEIAGSRFGVVINVEKTRVMATNGVLCDIRINGIRIAYVDSF